MKRTAQCILACIACGLIAVLVYAPKPWSVLSLLREELGRGLLLRDYVTRGVWYGAALDLIVILLLIATAGLWVGRATPSCLPEKAAPRRPLSRRGKTGIAVLILAGMLGSGIIAYPRLSHSLWGDEDFTLRFHLLGHFKKAYKHNKLEEGTLYFSKRGWHEAAFGYQTPNNHFLYTISGKLLLQAWQKAKDLPAYTFSEAVLRAPPFVTGLLSLGAWVILVIRLGLRWSSALPFVLLLWCNPWFIRYISEARGYAFVLLFLPLCLISLVGGLDHGRWRAWISYGIFQFLMLLSWPGIALQVVVVNLLVGALLVWRALRAYPKKRAAPVTPAPSGQGEPILPRKLEQIMRWGVVNLITVLALVPLLAATWPQAQEYFAESSPHVPVTGKWLANLAGLFLLGMPFLHYYEDLLDLNPHYLSIQGIAQTEGPWIYLYCASIFLFAFAGSIRFAAQARYGKLLVLALPGAALTMWLLGFLNERYIFHWYFISLQPFFFVLSGTGIAAVWGSICRVTGLGERQGSAHLRAALAGIGLLVIGICALGFSAPRLAILRDFSLDPLRESVLAIRGSSDPHGEGMRNTLLGHVNYGAYCYDPHGFPISFAFSNHNLFPGVTRLMRASDSYGIPLYFVVGFPADARMVLPQVMNMLDDEELFEPARIFWSSEPALVREIFRYRGGFFRSKSTEKLPAPAWDERYGNPVPPTMIPSKAERRRIRDNANARARASL